MRLVRPPGWLGRLRRDDLLLFVDEVRRVLRPDGRWIIHVSKGESAFFSGIRYGDLTHEPTFTRTSLVQLLLAAGFAEVRRFEGQPVGRGARSALRWLLWQRFRGLLRVHISAEAGDAGGGHIFSQNLLAVARN